MTPSLYAELDADEVSSLLRRLGDGERASDGSWIVSAAGAVCLASLDASGRGSRFDNGGTFRWVSGSPASLPPGVAGPSGEGLAIHLLVRGVGESRYTYIGTMGPTYRYTSPGSRTYGEAEFPLHACLPARVWQRLGGYDPGSLDHGQVDAALAGLRQTAGMAERLAVLLVLAEYWHGPLTDADRMDPSSLEGVAMPEALRSWYALAGRRTRILSGQNVLFEPQGLRIVDGKLQFYVENQYCYQWATDPAGEDTPVYGREADADPWTPEGLCVSEHLILGCLHEAVMGRSPYGAAQSCIEEWSLRPILEALAPVPIAPWGWGGETRFHAGGGVVLMTMSNGDAAGERLYSLWAGAKTDEALSFLRPHVSDDWEYVAL